MMYPADSTLFILALAWYTDTRNKFSELLRGSKYRCLEQIFMVPKGFEPSKFDCIT